MKRFAISVLFLIASNSFAQTIPATSIYNSYHVEVAELIFKGMLTAKVQPVCGTYNCSYSITDFDSYYEGDGCGGGVESSGASFTYADGKKYSWSACNDAVYGDDPDIGGGLNYAFFAVGRQGMQGWRRFIHVDKAECFTSLPNGSESPKVSYCSIIAPY